MSDNQLNWIEPYSQLIRGMELCRSQKLVLPSLILIYTAIDVAGWLASEHDDLSVRLRFTTWADKWMVQRYSLPCTAEELYSARCGLLHSLTPYSKLTRRKGVREVAYAWGSAKAEDNDEAARILPYPGLVTVQVERLMESFRQGFEDYLGMLDSNPVRKEAFDKRAGKLFTHIDVKTMSEFLALAQSNEHAES